MIQSLAAFFSDGGIFMYAILATGVIGLAIMIERAMVLIFRFNIDGAALWERIHRHIQDGHAEQALGLCKDLRIPLLKILHSGIKAHSHGNDEKAIQNSVDEAALEIIPTIDKRVGYLATLANISTLLGLLGTIQGLIQAFAAVGSAEPSQKAELLAKGISIALYTTAFGLIVAIPMLIMYSVFQAKSHKITDEIDEFSVKLINLLSAKNGVAGNPARQAHAPEHRREEARAPEHKAHESKPKPGHPSSEG
jgi:biopolymer transport protein ExbB/TolQ